MSVDVESLQLNISANSTAADDSLKRLSDSLDKLKKSLEGFDKLAPGLFAASEALKDLSKVDLKANGLSTFTNALARLTKAQDVSQIINLISALNSLNEVDFKTNGVRGFAQALARLANTDTARLIALTEQVRELSEAILSLNGANTKDTGVNSFVSSLGKISAEGGDTKNALDKVTRSTGSMTNAERIAMKVVDMFKASVKNAASALKTFASGLASLAGKVTSSTLTGIKNLTASILGLGNTAKRVNTLTTSLRTMLGVMIGFHGLYSAFNWAKEAVSSGADVAETNHIVEATFGELSDGVKNWAAKAIENYGLAETSAKRYAGTLGAMFKSSGIGTEEAQKMSMDLVGLAGDLSSFYNISQELAYSKIKSGMAGMVRPLRDLGIDLSAATLKEYALAQGIQTSYTNMTQAEKVMLRYNYLLSVTQQQQGDFLATSKSMANGLRVLHAYTQAITEAFGQGFAAALRHVVQGLIRAAKAVLIVAKAFQAFMETIFGKNLSGGGFTVDTSDLDSVSDTLDDAAGSAGDTSSNLGGAADNAKKLAKALSVLPFDELNQLNKDTESAGSGGSGGVGGGGVGDLGLGDIDFGNMDSMLDVLNSDMLPDAINRWALRIRKAFEAHDWIGLGRELAWGVNQGLKYLYDLLDPKNIEDKVLPYVRAFTITMNSLIDNIDWDLMGRTVGRGLNAITMIANEWLEGFGWTNLGKKLAIGANGLVDEIDWGSIGRLFANKLNSFWKTLYGFVSTFDWKGLGAGLAEGVNGFIDQIDFESISGSVTEGLNGITDAVLQFLADFRAEDFGAKIGNAFKQITDGVDGAKIGKALGHTWNMAWAMLKTAIRKLGDDEGKGTGIGKIVHDIVSNAIATIKVGDMINSINTFVQKVAEDIIEVFGDEKMWADLGTKIGKVIGGILSDGATWQKIGEALNAIASGLRILFENAIRELRQNHESIKENIKQFLKGLDWQDIGAVVGAFAIIEFAKAIPGIIEWAVLATTIKGAITPVIAQGVSEGIAGATGAAATAGATGAATAAAATGESLLTGLGMWTGPLGVLGVALIGATLGNTPEARAEVQRSKEALDQDIKEMSNGVEQAFAGTGYTLESLAGQAAENAIKMTEEMKQQMSISLTAMQRKGVITKAQLGQINGAIYSGNQDVIKIVQEMETAWKEGDTARVQSSANAAMQIIHSLGSEKTSLSNVKTAVSTASTSFNALSEATENTATKANDAVEKNELLAEKFGRVGTKARNAKTDQENYNAAVNATPSLWDTIKSLAANFLSTLLGSFGAKKDYKKKGKNMPEGVGEGIDEGTGSALTAMSKMSQTILATFTKDNGMHSPSQVYSKLSENIPAGVAQGVENAKSKAINAVQKLAKSMSDEFTSQLTKIENDLRAKGRKTIENGLISGVRDALGHFSPSSEIDRVFSGVWGTLSSIASQMYNAGQNISQSLANGITSIHIPLPYISTYWETIYYGDGSWVQIPNFSLNWYKKGALFTDATIAGFGEAGDEAALPLTDKRAMNRIANAIIDNSGGAFGNIDEDALASAVAQGYVRAMMMNQGNQPQPIFNIVVKTEDNEVLARAVQRGNQSIDYRNNPTPRYSY